MKKPQYPQEFKEEVIEFSKTNTKYATCKKYNIHMSTLNAWLNPDRTRERNNKYYENHKDEINSRKKEEYKQKREQHLINCREYDKKNKATRVIYDKQYYQENKEKNRERNKKYTEENRDKINTYKKTYSANKRRVDKNFQISSNLRGRLYKVITQEHSSAIDLLGTDLDSFSEYIGNQFHSGMSWDNYGPYWHLDHIKPCSSFNLEDIYEQRKCFHYTNLQPLLVLDNLTKSNKQPNILAIINCSATKKDYECEARHMYNDSLMFSTLQSYVSNVFPSYGILSAHYGYLEQRQMIEPYNDVVMFVSNNLLHSGKQYKKLTAEEKKEWAKRVMVSIPFDDYDEVRFFCGNTYTEYIKPIANVKCRFIELPQGINKVIERYKVWNQD
jgi:transposase-like protein